MDVAKYGFDKIRNKVGGTGLRVPDTVMLRYLSKIGEDMCAHARENKGGHPLEYEDQTANLRSSIGYRIYKNGTAIVDGGFAESRANRNEKSKGEIQDGEEAAKKALDAYEAANTISVDGWTIVLVAGMKYAVYVEAKGYNVLHLTALKMREAIENLQQRLNAQ